MVIVFFAYQKVGASVKWDNSEICLKQIFSHLSIYFTMILVDFVFLNL